MRKIIFIVGILFSFPSCAQTQFWENLNSSQKTEILELCKSEPIKEFYEGQHTLSDDKKTIKLLDELIASDDSTLPLSFYLFNKVCIQSDGALSEVLGEYCMLFIAQHPKFVLTYFSKSGKDTLLKIYTSYIGEELYYKKDGLSDVKYDYSTLKNTLNDVIIKNQNLKGTFDVFWRSVDEIMNNME